MKIAMVSPTILPNRSAAGLVGGAESYVMSLSLELAKLNHSVTLITSSKNESYNYFINGNFEVKCFKTRAPFIAGESIPSEQIIRTLNSDNYEIIHEHQIFTFFNMLSGICARTKKIPSFATDHGGGSAFCRAMPSIGATIPKSFIAVSNFSLQYLHHLVPEKKSIIAYGGVDTGIFNPMSSVDNLRTELGLDGCRIVLCVGRIMGPKGIDIIIRAMHHLPDNVKLLVLGPVINQVYFQYLQELASKIAPRVLFLGQVNAEMLPKYYNLCDVFVQSSVTRDCYGNYYRFSELLGLVKFEAMACGKPVIVSDVGGLPEQIFKGLNGYIVREGDELELAKAIGTILADDSLREKMGQRSLQLIRENFSWRQVAKKVVDFYNSSTH